MSFAPYHFGRDLLRGTYLQVLREMLNFVGIQELPDDVGGLQMSDGLDVILDGAVIVVLRVQVVAILPVACWRKRKIWNLE